jgi:hypothetical protein
MLLFTVYQTLKNKREGGEKRVLGLLLIQRLKKTLILKKIRKEMETTEEGSLGPRLAFTMMGFLFHGGSSFSPIGLVVSIPDNLTS